MRIMPSKPNLSCMNVVGGRIIEVTIWEFPRIRGTFLGVLIIRILPFRVLY